MEMILQIHLLQVQMIVVLSVKQIQIVNHGYMKVDYKNVTLNMVLEQLLNVLHVHMEKDHLDHPLLLLLDNVEL